MIHNDHVQIQFQRFFRTKFGLRHSTLERIYHQDNTVYHLQDTFYLAAEVRMAWGVDDVDFGIFVINSCILGERIVIPRSRSISLESMTRSWTS